MDIRDIYILFVTFREYSLNIPCCLGYPDFSNVIIPQQRGFVKKRSSETNLLTYMNYDIRKCNMSSVAL